MKKSINSSDYKMLIWSFDFIQHHADVTTDEVPDELIRFWTVPDFTTNPQWKPGNTQLMVFMYALRLQDCERVEAELLMNSYRFNRLFFSFQVVLAATAYYREKGIEQTPFPLFDIGRYAVPDLSDGEQLLREYRNIIDNGKLTIES